MCNTLIFFIVVINRFLFASYTYLHILNKTSDMINILGKNSKTVHPVFEFFLITNLWWKVWRAHANLTMVNTDTTKVLTRYLFSIQRRKMKKKCRCHVNDTRPSDFLKKKNVKHLIVHIKHYLVITSVMQIPLLPKKFLRTNLHLFNRSYQSLRIQRFVNVNNR